MNFLGWMQVDVILTHSTKLGLSQRGWPNREKKQIILYRTKLFLCHRGLLNWKDSILGILLLLTIWELRKPQFSGSNFVLRWQCSSSYIIRTASITPYQSLSTWKCDSHLRGISNNFTIKTRIIQCDRSKQIGRSLYLKLVFINDGLYKHLIEIQKGNESDLVNTSYIYRVEHFCYNRK